MYRYYTKCIHLNDRVQHSNKHNNTHIGIILMGFDYCELFTVM